MAGVVCPVAGARPVAGAHYPVAGVIHTIVEEIHSVAVVACPVAGVVHCVARINSKSTVIGALLDCPFT